MQGHATRQPYMPSHCCMVSTGIVIPASGVWCNYDNLAWKQSLQGLSYKHGDLYIDSQAVLAQ